MIRSINHIVNNYHTPRHASSLPLFFSTLIPLLTFPRNAFSLGKLPVSHSERLAAILPPENISHVLNKRSLSYTKENKAEFE